MLLVAGAMERCCEQPEHEKWVPLFKIQVFFSCVSFSIIVPSLANYLRRMGAEEWVLGVAVAVYSLGEMVGSAVFGKIITKRLREQPATGPRRALLETMVFGVVGSVLYVVADGVGQNLYMRPYAPWVVVLGRFLGGIWTGGKMVCEAASNLLDAVDQSLAHRSWSRPTWASRRARTA